MFELWGVVDFSSRKIDFNRLLWRRNSDSHFPAPPSSDSISSGIQISADADLFNERDLVASHGDQASVEEIICLSYRKWGEAFPLHLEGEFSIAIWDGFTDTLYLVVDHLGMRPLYYWHADNRVAFASDPMRILRLPFVPRRLNRKKLAGLTVAGGWEFLPEETIHAGVLAVPPGSFVKVSRRRISTRTYWRANANIEPLQLPDRDIIELARERLFSAVRRRVRNKGRVAAWLSGGLDSSAVVSVASKCLLQENRSLTAFAAVVPNAHAATVRDEREYIEEFRSWPNIEIQFVDAEGRGPFDLLRTPTELERCFTLTPRRYHEEALERAACDWQADVTLIGCFGELTITDRCGGFYAELTKRLQWAALWRELLERAKAQHRQINPIRMLRPLATDILDWLSPLRGWIPQICFAREFMHESEGEWAPRLLSPGTAARLQFSLDAYWRRQGTRHSTRGAERVHAAASYPLFDKDLLELCLAIPPRLKLKNGRPRNLVREVLAGIAPLKIQQRSSKIPFSPDYYIRFNSQLPQAREFIASIRSNDPVRSIVDVERVKRLLQPVDPLGRSVEALIAPLNLYVICFLRQFAEFQV